MSLPVVLSLLCHTLSFVIETTRARPLLQTGTKPVCVLIDCSELELGRNLGQRHGRVDDNLDAYKRRLQLYRELSLPLLKTLDEENRLKIVRMCLRG